MQVDLQRLILWVLGLGVALLLLTFVPYVLVLLVVIVAAYFIWRRMRSV